MTEHPIQPVITDEHGTQRFKANKIVQYLLDNGGIDMNAIARLPFDDSDREQFAQLIGYSLCGFSELRYARDVTYEAAQKMADSGMSAESAKIAALSDQLSSVRESLRELVPLVFQINPDDLTN